MHGSQISESCTQGEELSDGRTDGGMKGWDSHAAVRGMIVTLTADECPECTRADPWVRLRSL